MRTIEKGEGCPKLQNRYILHQQQLAEQAFDADWDPWSRFRSKRRAPTLANCLREQFGLCAYSEVFIMDDSEFGKHVDHVDPRCHNPARTFDHTNLLMSAFGSDDQKRHDHELVFGGHARPKEHETVDYEMHLTCFVHPLCQTQTGQNSGELFHYGMDGKVVPNDALDNEVWLKVDHTIKMLNLNSPLLIDRRSRVLDALAESIDELIGDVEALAALARCELAVTERQLPQFYSSIWQQLEMTGVAMPSRI